MSKHLDSIVIDATKKQIGEIKEMVDFRNEEYSTSYLNFQKVDNDTFTLTIQSNNIVNAELLNILRLASIPITRADMIDKVIYRFTPKGDMTATLHINCTEEE